MLSGKKKQARSSGMQDPLAEVVTLVEAFICAVLAGRAAFPENEFQRRAWPNAIANAERQRRRATVQEVSRALKGRTGPDDSTTAAAPSASTKAGHLSETGLLARTPFLSPTSIGLSAYVSTFLLGVADAIETADLCAVDLTTVVEPSVDEAIQMPWEHHVTLTFSTETVQIASGDAEVAAVHEGPLFGPAEIVAFLAMIENTSAAFEFRMLSWRLDLLRRLPSSARAAEGWQEVPVAGQGPQAPPASRSASTAGSAALSASSPVPTAVALGSARDGDLRGREVLPVAALCGLRCFITIPQV
jgi:hypothetical protein